MARTSNSFHLLLLHSHPLLRQFNAVAIFFLVLPKWEQKHRIWTTFDEKWMNVYPTDTHSVFVENVWLCIRPEKRTTITQKYTEHRKKVLLFPFEPHSLRLTWVAIARQRHTHTDTGRESQTMTLKSRCVMKKWWQWTLYECCVCKDIIPQVFEGISLSLSPFCHISIPFRLCQYVVVM